MNREGKSRRKGMSVIEYSFLLAICVGALLAMEIYIKRGVEGRLRFTVDQLSDATFYAPGETSTYTDTEINKNIHTETSFSRARQGALGIGDDVYKSITCIGGELVADENGAPKCVPLATPKPYLEIKTDEGIGPVS